MSQELISLSATIISYLLSEKFGQQLPEDASRKIWHKVPPGDCSEKSAKSSFTRDYAAPWPPQSKKGFLGRLAREKSPKVSVLEAESSRRRNDSTSFLEKVIFSKIFAYHTFGKTRW
jgi:hypothetical protein